MDRRITSGTLSEGDKDNNGQLRLHDSMEFYKSLGITNSPPKMEIQTLLVGEDEEEFGFVEESPVNAEEIPEEEEGIQLAEVGEDFAEFERYSSNEEDDDDIIFADSDSEEKVEEVVPSTPFWFGNEEKEQLRFINETYAVALKLEEERKKMVRQPEPFVGKIQRSKVDNGGVFTTLDSVEIYRRSLLPPGSVMPFVKRAFFLTEWSVEDGVPVHLNLLHSEGMKTMWKKKVIKSEEPSILFCLPEYGTNQYEFSVSSQNAEVTHSPSSLHTIEKRGWYDKYIPEELRHPNGPEEGVSDG